MIAGAFTAATCLDMEAGYNITVAYGCLLRFETLIVKGSRPLTIG